MTPDQILAATSAFFGQPVVKLTAPGGRSRESLRAHFAQGTVIVSQRKNSAAARLEGHILLRLAPLTPHVPRLLGSTQGLVFQQDAGANRLNWFIHTLPPGQRASLALQAIDALLDMHRAARQAGLAADLPPGGLRRMQGEDLFAGAHRLFQQLGLSPQAFRPEAFSPLFQRPPQAFTKCDCRAGNAALDATGLLRWFDFEDARPGHGPEDFAWLLADESFPVPMAELVDLLEPRLSAEDAPDRPAYLVYLQEYAVLQAIRRLRLIFSDAKRKGWLGKAEVLKYDRVGTNPHLGQNLAQAAASLARRLPSTRPLVPVLDQAADVFRRVRQKPVADLS